MKPTISRVVGVAILQHQAVACAVALAFAVLALGVAGALSEPRNTAGASLDGCEAGCPAIEADLAAQESSSAARAPAAAPRGETLAGAKSDGAAQEAPSPGPPSTGSGGTSPARDVFRGAGWAVIIAILSLIGAFMVAESRTGRRR